MAAAETPRDKGSVSLLAEGAGAALIFIGAYSPWVVTFALFTSVPVRGVDVDWGQILPLIPLAALGLLAWRWYARHATWVHAAILALGIVTLVFALAYAVHVKRNLTKATESLRRAGQFPGAIDVRFDIGMYLSVAGSAAMIGGGILGISGNKQKDRAAAAARSDLL